MPLSEFVKIIHPPTGNIAEVPRSSLAAHYAAGWAPLDESAEAEHEPVPPPAPVRAPVPEPFRAPEPEVPREPAATPDTSNEENE